MGRLCFVLALFAVPLCMCALVAQSAPPASEEAVAEQPAVEPAAEINRVEAVLNKRVRRLLQNELCMVRQACHPTKQQLAEISRAGDAVAGAIVKSAVEGGVDVGDEQMIIVSRTGLPWNAPLENQQQISKKLVEALNSTMSAEAAAQYQEECDARLLSWKQALADGLVAGLDCELALSAAQRAIISRKFVEGWPQGWDALIDGSVEFSILPDIPDELIVPYLTEAQYKTWSGSMQVGGSSAFMVRWIFGARNMDTEFSDEAFEITAEEVTLPEAPKAEILPPDGGAPENPEQEARKEKL